MARARTWFALTAAVLAGSAVPAVADGAPPPPQVVTSAEATGSSVTIYRAPHGGDGEFDLNWLEGYALITETREVTIPAGRATIRFEGVAAGMLPESAIVTGLPAGVSEKNLDAELLSPRNLYARSFGRPVILRRTHAKTGAVREERAVIRSAPDGSVILQTAAGFEAADCGPLNEELVYPGVPDGLSARPTLSVETQAPAPARVRLTLSYLAWGFDWRTSYVLRMRPDGRHADVTAWVTLASSDTTSFPGTMAAVVGGKPNFDEARDGNDREPGDLEFHCYVGPVAPPVMLGMTASAAPMITDEADIIVTAMGRENKASAAPITVQGEDLGDLKLYRMPIPTTVAARAQKQVALFDRKVVTVTPIYSAWIGVGTDTDAALMLRTRNRPQDGLGIALPAGRTQVFEPHRGEFVLVGGGTVADKAVGEIVEFGVGRSPQVHVTSEQIADGEAWSDHQVTVTNANPRPIRFEGKAAIEDGARISRLSHPLGRKDGQWLWAVTVPANGRAVLTYRVREPE